MPRSAALRPRAFQMHGQHAVGSHFAQRASGYGVRQHSIDQIAPANFDRQEHSGISAAGADRINDRAGMKYDALAGVEIRGGYAERDAEILKPDALQGARQKR